MDGGYKERIVDVLRSVARIEEKTKGLTKEAFIRDAEVAEAVAEELHRIGTAIGRIAVKIKRRYPDIDWAAMEPPVRPDADALWDLATRQAPVLGKQANRILLDVTD